jgi:site-specific recombinase XerD
MKEAIAKYLEYLRSVKNSSPHTVLNYGTDLDQFLAYLSPPGAPPPTLAGVKHPMIREFIAHLHDQGLEKSSSRASSRRCGRSSSTAFARAI